MKTILQGIRLACCLFIGLIALEKRSYAGGGVAAWGYYYDLTIPETYRPMYVPPGLTNVTAIAGGYNHALALRSDGKITAWGWNGNGLTNVPTSASNAVAIFAGGAGSGYSLALRNDGKVIGWGYSGYGGEVVPPTLSNVVAIADHLALKADGTVVSWGGDLGGAYAVPAGLDHVTAICSGLALKADGTLVGWNSYGKLASNIPPGLTNIDRIASGVGHFLVLKSDGSVVAWGNNFYGQTNVPPGLSNVVSIAAGTAHSLAVKNDGTVIAWGAGTNVAPLIDPRKGQSIVPDGLSNVVAAAGGRTFSLAIQSDGKPFLLTPLLNRKVAEGAKTELNVAAVGMGSLSYQWQFFGTNIPGATNASFIIAVTLLSDSGPYSVTVSNDLGSASSTNTLEVVPILITSNPTDQFAYMWGETSFEVRAYGREQLIYQWKFNGVNLPGQTNSVLQLTNLQLSQVGNYSVAISNSVGNALSQSASLSLSQVAAWGGQSVPQGWTNIMAIAAGAQGSMVLLTNETVSAVGFDVINIPPGLNGVIAIAAGGQFADGGCGMALRSNGTVVVWGDTRYDQQITPSGLSNVVAIAVGTHHCLALKSDGTLNGWGWGFHGQTSVPSGLSNVVAISGGYGHSLALVADGSVVSFGSISPPPPDLANVVAIAAGREHNLALRDDGTVVGWGNNSSGQANVPAGLSNVVSIACGQRHSVALDRAGKVTVWGATDYGQTNLPVGMPEAVSIAAAGVHSLALFGGQTPTLSARITNLIKTNGTFRLSLPTLSGRVYRLEYKNSLLDVQWTPLPLVAGTGRTLVLTDPDANESQRFYRVRQW